MAQICAKNLSIRCGVTHTDVKVVFGADFQKIEHPIRNSNPNPNLNLNPTNFKKLYPNPNPIKKSKSESKNSNLKQLTFNISKHITLNITHKFFTIG